MGSFKDSGGKSIIIVRLIEKDSQLLPVIIGSVLILPVTLASSVFYTQI